jgi:hypothetical protein
MVGFLKRATGTSGLPNQFDRGPDSDWVNSVGGQYAQSNNPGSRRARLAGAVHRDDRHLDTSTGEFVTVVVARRFSCACRQDVNQALPDSSASLYTLGRPLNYRTFPRVWIMSTGVRHE